MTADLTETLKPAEYKFSTRPSVFRESPDCIAFTFLFSLLIICPNDKDTVHYYKYSITAISRIGIKWNLSGRRLLLVSKSTLISSSPSQLTMSIGGADGFRAAIVDRFNQEGWKVIVINLNKSGEEAEARADPIPEYVFGDVSSKRPGRPR